MQGEEETLKGRFAMRRKQVYMLLSAAGAVIGLGSVANAQVPVVGLSLAAANGSWTAYASEDSGTDNIGLATLSIDVVGSGGATVTGSYIGNLNPSDTTSSTAIPISEGESFPKSGTKKALNVNVGFQEFVSNGVGSTATSVPGNGVAIEAGQNVTYGSTNSSASDPEIVQGLGKSGTTSFTGTFPATANTVGGSYTQTWTNPIEIASGTYSGKGTLTLAPDESSGHGIQTLNIVSNGKWFGPGNVTTDLTSGNDGLFASIAVGTTVTSTPFISLSGTAAGANSGGDALAGATVTPSSDDVNDQIVEHTTDGSHYDAIHIHEAGNGSDNADFNFAGFSAGSTIDMLLKFSTASGGDPATNASVLSDIENYINGNDSAGITVSAVPAGVASAFPGTTYDLMLSATAGANDPFADFDFASFSDSSLASGSLTVSDIGVVPEPASLGLLVLGGVGLIGRRRSKKDSK